jgi:phospholipase/carboxylesterase
MRRIRAASTILALFLGPQTADQSAVAVLVNPESGLRTWEAGPGSTPLLLLHGYGSSPQDWLPFTRTIVPGPSMRFVFPEGPVDVGSAQSERSRRAWWRMNLGDYRRGPEVPVNLSRSRPAGLVESSSRVVLLMHDLQHRLHYDSNQMVLGGFSQGAMVAAETAFRTSEPLKSLVLLSVTTVDERGWLEGMRRRTGLRVFIAHGRQDDVLSFDSAQRLEQQMRAAGLRVTWVPFDGKHEMPMEVVNALNRFLEESDR